MAEQHALIDWPLTPYTGWGGYGIQLAQALLERRQYWPRLLACNDRSSLCDLHWLDALQHLENESATLAQQVAAAEGAGTLPFKTKAALGFSPLGNLVPKPRFTACKHVGVTFFECSQFSDKDLETLKQFDLVISGSRWNQALLKRQGIDRSHLVHQGVDTAVFNPEPVPQLLKRSIIIFSGGKLENRKGQDIVIAAFKNLLRHYPDALLIAAWGNVGHVGINTIADSPHVQGSPGRGRADAIGPWLEANGIPSSNVFLLPCVVNRQLPHLIKQADVAVFASRCEGGTNLMAMETLACGVPTLISANTGHLDLLAMGFGHALPIGKAGSGQVDPRVHRVYGGDPLGLWGETDPEELLAWWLKIAVNREEWRCIGRQHADALKSLSWRESMRKLLLLVEEVPPS
tara:strand:+ start:1115 stop:2323 length:1209 start_codon:yes stop_codon:yes gene_type:complete